MSNIRIDYLAKHPHCLPVLRGWFEHEWPRHYGPGGAGNAEADLAAYSRTDVLPTAVVAFCDDVLCGVAALKPQSISSRPELGPWAGAGLVPAPYRRRGIGGELLAAVEKLAASLGFPRVYCGTSTSVGLLERRAWCLVERIDHDGAVVSIYEKVLQPSAPVRCS